MVKNRQTKRGKVKVRLEVMDTDLFVGTTEEIIAKLNKINELAKKQNLENPTICIDEGWDDYPTVIVFAFRNETDKEMAKRIERNRKDRARETKKKAAKNKRDFELYQKLKKKFEYHSKAALPVNKSSGILWK